MSGGGMQRFLGGSPVGVLVKLIFVSLIVGAIMAFLGLSPRGLYESIARFIRSIADMGFGAVRDVGDWLIAGALVVVPVWLLMRIFASRK